MNDDLQAKLQKRRQVADGTIEPELSIDDLLYASPRSHEHHNHHHNQRSSPSDSNSMSADLKAAMERQRRKVDVIEEDNKTTTKRPQQRSSDVSSSTTSNHKDGDDTTAERMIMHDDEDVKPQQQSSRSSKSRERGSSNNNNNNSTTIPDSATTGKKRSSRRSHPGGNNKGMGEKKPSTQSLATSSDEDANNNDKPSSSSASRKQQSSMTTTSGHSANSSGNTSSSSSRRFKESAPSTKSGNQRERAADEDARTLFPTEDAFFGSTDMNFPETTTSAKASGSESFLFPSGFEDEAAGSSHFPVAPTHVSTSSPDGFFDTTDNMFATTRSSQRNKQKAAKSEPVYWDKSPHETVPTTSVTSSLLSLSASTSLAVDKPFLYKPLTHPLNGNLILATATVTQSAAGCPCWQEVDPHRDCVSILAAPIVSSELQQRVATKYNATISRLDKIVCATLGLHALHGQARLRLSCIMDLHVLESNQPLLRVLVVWQWGYGAPHPVSLQFVMSLPPSNTKNVRIQAESLQCADGLLFLAGFSTTTNEPCVYICKPSVGETWSMVTLQSCKSPITELAVTLLEQRTARPYLAVALQDGSVSVWDYRVAMSGASHQHDTDSEPLQKQQQQNQQWLLPLCQLDALSVLQQQKTGVTVDENGDDEDASIKPPGYCTQLSWLPPQPSMGSLLLLATSFQNGLAIFHVEVPIVVDSNTGETTTLPLKDTLTQSPTLSAMSVARWKGQYESSQVSWLTMGPYLCPNLSILLHSARNKGTRSSTTFLIWASLRWSQYRRGPPPKERLVPLDVIARHGFESSSKRVAAIPDGLLHSSGCNAASCYSKTHVISVALVRGKDNVSDSCVKYIGYPITSCPSGLTSTGEILLTDTDADKEGVLFLYCVTQCERQKCADTDTNLANMQEWAHPRKRLWLCRTLVGDSKAAGAIKEDEKKDNGFGNDQVVLGGATNDAICEVFDEGLEGLDPLRIVRCNGYELCAILFRPRMSRKDGSSNLSLNASVVAFIDSSSSKPSIYVTDGCDVAFIPAGSDDAPRGVILSKDGGSLAWFTWDAHSKSCNLGSVYRPIVGIETDDNYVACRRVLAFCGPTAVGLVVVGGRARDGRACLVSGDMCQLSDLSPNGWSQLLPNIVSGRCLWLQEQEEVFTIIGLQGDADGYRNFGIATSDRVVIVSSGMEVSAERRVTVSSCGLAPLGSFAMAYCAGEKIFSLSCLDGQLATGAIATMALPKYGHAYMTLLAVRPDRLIVGLTHNGIRCVDVGHNPNIFLLPAPTTRAALLLEAMIANAICVGGKRSESTAILRVVIEKFGRKVGSITHGDDEGIGSLGAGLTSRTFEMLSHYGLTHAVSWLLTGTTLFDRSANTKVLPPWLPIASKTKACLNADAFLHVLASGDPYFAEYVKDPDQKMPSILPRQSDSASYIAREYAMDALRNGQGLAALKLLDVGGSESCDAQILQLALVAGKDRSKDSTALLKTLSGYGEPAMSSLGAPIRAPSSLAALAVSLKETRGRGMKPEDIGRWMKPLAPSLQKGNRTLTRSRQRIFGDSQLSHLFKKESLPDDPLWMSYCNESKHVWNEGPRKEKNQLMSLGTIEEWIGRRRPVILGKEGASASKDRGEKTLADILNQVDDDSFGGSDIESVQDGWVDGVGEGRTDEANLSAYFRFSEGDDEESSWPTEGFADLSPFQNKALVVGDSQSIALQPTTSSVDEGDPGKVKSLYDVVFEKSGTGASSGLAISASRGGSLDVGLLHLAEKTTRQKCTVEFWYYLASSENTPAEVVLARRTFGSSADDLANVCIGAKKSSVLWELVLLANGELQFRSCSGDVLKSTVNYDPTAKATNAGDSDDEKDRNDLAKFGRWNHVCVVLKSTSITNCSVSLYMKGEEVASSDLSMAPSGLGDKELDGAMLNDLLQKSYMLFGLNHGAGFRLTELRVWACSRSADDTQALMYEYLTAAEAKKKFKVKISSNKNSGGARMGKGTFLAPPGTGGPTSSRGLLGGPKGSVTRGVLATKSDLGTKGLSLAPPPKKDDQRSLAPSATTPVDVTLHQTGGGFDNSFGFTSAFKHQLDDATKPNDVQEMATDDIDDEVPTTLWDTAIPLSQQIRASAASALIRGPPATRHFGGNRGGLADFSGMERFGVGGIAICGSEKTIVWRDNEDPPALTYPIGASGAIVSDLMDDEGSEFLCCFLAKEKRMVVFELQSRTVVVELQMTTKLNFWRFLPPEAAERTLCFMLVTPVGGFHWMPLEESPRPHQVWKRGAELQGKKVVNYEEGGSNGLEGPDILSRVGLVMVSQASGGRTLEAWLVPIEGDSQACQISDDVMGACFCQPPHVEDGPFLPLLVTAHQLEDGIYINVLSVVEPRKGSIQLGEIELSRFIDETGFEDAYYEPPAMAMGSFPEAILCSLGNIIVVIIRSKGLIAAFELEDDDLSLIALEGIGHYVVDAVMRYSGEVGGAEIVMLLADEKNHKDGRMVSFCFRSAA